VRQSLPRVLIIENSDIAALLLRQALECRGYAVESAATGMQGIQRTRALRPEQGRLLVGCRIRFLPAGPLTDAVPGRVRNLGFPWLRLGPQQRV